ncbi:MAG: GH92 family glycosyl hydrolase, partial [Pseudomonadota bacterium]
MMSVIKNAFAVLLPIVFLAPPACSGGKDQGGDGAGDAPDDPDIRLDTETQEDADGLSDPGIEGDAPDAEDGAPDTGGDALDTEEVVPPPACDDLPVNLFIGTGGNGYGAGSMVPGPQTPNGMIRPGPDTSQGSLVVDFQHFSGYSYADSDIRGFSHTRLVGVGAIDMGNVRLMPVMGNGASFINEDAYRSGFSHANETAYPGYYQVRLDAFGINAELSAAPHAAIHRYTFPLTAEQPSIILDAGASIAGGVEDGVVHISPDLREISGELVMHGAFCSRYGGLPIYYVVRFSEPFPYYGTFVDETALPGGVDALGDRVGAYVGFGTDGPREILAAVGLSTIDVDQARANLDAEIPELDFDAVVRESCAAWRDRLDRVEIEGGSESQRKIFMTALYHAAMMPTLFTEQGGRYMGFDGAAHVADDFTYYTDMSLWDTFRTLHPLMTLLEPDLSRDFVISLITMYEQGGALPMWPMGRGYTGCMIGTHSDSVIAEAYIKGITDFDVETAYRGMVEHATTDQPHAGRSDLEHYQTLGYCTTDAGNDSVSITLEYAYDDYCIGTLARALGHEEDAALMLERGGNYSHLWDGDQQFMRARSAAGDWKDPFNPLDFSAPEYVEGDAWHWMWFVPHDVPGLIGLFGGADRMVDKLETFFQMAALLPDTALPDLYYWHGNEPDLHAAYLFALAGRPDLTQEWARWVMADKYRDGPDGIDGNDDGGTISSWYIFSAMGLYPLNPCDGRYVIGSPLFDTVTLHLDGGDLVINALNNPET